MCWGLNGRLQCGLNYGKLLVMMNIYCMEQSNPLEKLMCWSLFCIASQSSTCSRWACQVCCFIWYDSEMVVEPLLHFCLYITEISPVEGSLLKSYFSSLWNLLKCACWKWIAFSILWHKNIFVFCEAMCRGQNLQPFEFLYLISPLLCQYGILSTTSKKLRCSLWKIRLIKGRAL